MPILSGLDVSLQVFVYGILQIVVRLLDKMAFITNSCLKDVVKNRYMTQPDVNPPRFPTVRSVAKFVYQTEGLKGFYRGNAYDICQC